MLSIVIVNYKNPPLLRLCLSSLRRVLPESFAHEIIVVDISATTETRNICQEEFSSIHYLPFQKNIGYTAGVNKGIEAAAGDTFFVINTDIIPLEGSVESLYAYLRAHPQVGIVGPQLLNFNGSLQQSSFRYYTPWTIICRRTFIGSLPGARHVLDRFLLKDKNLSQPTAVDWLLGSALMVTRTAYEKVGPMDTRLFLYMSDVDWPRRFWENGSQQIPKVKRSTEGNFL